MNEERFGFLSSTDDGNTLFADIPSEAVSMYCRYGLIKLSEDGRDLDVPQGGGGRVSELEGIDDGGGVAHVPVKEEVIGLGVEQSELSDSSEDDSLLLKPGSSPRA